MTERLDNSTMSLYADKENRILSAERRGTPFDDVFSDVGALPGLGVFFKPGLYAILVGLRFQLSGGALLKFNFKTPPQAVYGTFETNPYP